MATYDDLQTTQKRVLGLITSALANEHGDGTNITAESMRNVLATALTDGYIVFDMCQGWVHGSTAVDGTALAKFADGASAVPGLTLANEQIGIRWNNHANPDAIGRTFVVPPDMDTAQAATMYFLAHKVGATGGDAVTWLVTAFSVGDGDLADSDADFGGTSSAMTGAAATKTCQLESLTLAANSMTNLDTVTITVQPTDGTLGTDDVVLQAVYIRYKKKLA